MEVVMIVISFGLAEGNHDQLLTATLAALVAVVVMTVIGALVAKPLAKVPENYMKIGVGILLTVFGLFWMGEGVGVQWPMGDVFHFSALSDNLFGSIVPVCIFQASLQAHDGV